MACKMPEKRLAPTAPAMMIAPAYQMYHDRSAKTTATTMPTIQEVAVERNPVPKISCITPAPTKNPVTAPNTGSRMNQNRKPKKQAARPTRARTIPTRISMASLHPQRMFSTGLDPTTGDPGHTHGAMSQGDAALVRTIRTPSPKSTGLYDRVASRYRMSRNPEQGQRK